MFKLSEIKTDKKRFFLDLISKLIEYPKEHEPKVYIGGTGDSHQSWAEKLYIGGELGVISTSEKVGNVLVVIVGMIINGNYTYMQDMLSGNIWERRWDEECDKFYDGERYETEIKFREHIKEQKKKFASKEAWEKFFADDITMKDIFKLGDAEDCNSSHPLHEKSTIILNDNKTKIMIDPKRMNLWDIDRIYAYLMETDTFM